MGNRLEGKVAIVTGGTRGIGKGIATAFVNEGAKVLFTGRDRTLGTALEAELGKNTRFMPVDVAKESEVAAMVKTGGAEHPARPRPVGVRRAAADCRRCRLRRDYGRGEAKGTVRHGPPELGSPGTPR